MRIFDVSGCRAEIVRPGMPLAAWTAQQTPRPFAVCNASLYVCAGVPVGTIIEGGQLVHDDGNGYGFGIADGEPRFGGPWERAWSDYLTGYNSPVQNGIYVAPTFADPYVFGCRLARIGVGRKAGKLVLVTDDFVTLEGFARAAIAAGVDTLVNLDGGGSRHLWYDGRLIYGSQRVPYNALAFYKEHTSSGADAPPSPQGEGKKPCEDCTEDGRCGRWRE